MAEYGWHEYPAKRQTFSWWHDPEQRFVVQVLALTFVGNILAILLPSLVTHYSSQLGFEIGLRFFNAWPWGSLAMAVTGANFMCVHAALIHAKMESDGLNGVALLYVLWASFVLIHFVPKFDEPWMSDSSPGTIFVVSALVNYASLHALKGPIRKRIWAMTLELYEKGTIAAVAKAEAMQRVADEVDG